MSTVTGLRALEPGDHDAVFAMMADPAATAMAAFTADDPHDRAAFDTHLHRVLSDPGIDHLAVVEGEGRLVGTISTFPSDDGRREVTYWIDRAHWGRGHASRALSLMLARTRRPVIARVATDNRRSRRVLAKAGFEVEATNRDYAPGRGSEIDELVLRLD